MSYLFSYKSNLKVLVFNYISDLKSYETMQQNTAGEHILTANGFDAIPTSYSTASSSLSSDKGVGFITLILDGGPKLCGGILSITIVNLHWSATC